MNLFNALGEVFLFAIAILLAAGIAYGIIYAMLRVIKLLRSSYYSFNYVPRKVTKIYAMRYSIALYDICASLIDLGIFNKKSQIMKEFFDAVDTLRLKSIMMCKNHGYSSLPPHEAAIVDLIQVMRVVANGIYHNEVSKSHINYTPGETDMAKELLEYAEDTDWKFCDLWLEDKDQYYDEEGEEEDDTRGISGDKS